MGRYIVSKKGRTLCKVGPPISDRKLYTVIINHIKLWVYVWQFISPKAEGSIFSHFILCWRHQMLSSWTSNMSLMMTSWSFWWLPVFRAYYYCFTCIANCSLFCDSYMCGITESLLDKMIVWSLFNGKPIPKPVIMYIQYILKELYPIKILHRFRRFIVKIPVRSEFIVAVSLNPWNGSILHAGHLTLQHSLNNKVYQIGTQRNKESIENYNGNQSVNCNEVGIVKSFSFRVVLWFANGMLFDGLRDQR